MWIKVSDNAFTGELVELSQAAKLLHLSALCACAEKLTDGYLTAPRLLIAAAAVGATPAVAAELVEAGLWEARAGGDFVLVTYTRDNPTAEKVAKEREQNATRQKNFRDKQKAQKAAEEARKAADTNARRNGVTTPVTNGGDATRDADRNAVTNGVGHGGSNARPRLPSPSPVSRDSSPEDHAPAERPSVFRVPPNDGDGRPGIVAVKPRRDTCLNTAQLAEFDAWWFGPWPQVRRSNRKQAEQQWKRVNGDGALTEEIMSGTQRQHEQDKWRRGYIPHPHNFLRDERWKDEIDLGGSQRPSAIDNANEAIRRIYARDESPAQPGPIYEGTFTRRA